MSDPYNNGQPLSEIYRTTAKKWVDAHAAAELLEETKTLLLQSRTLELVAAKDISFAEAERRVKASAEWMEWITEMVEKRKQATLLKCQLEYVRMRHSEQVSAEASQRAEMRL